MPSLGATRLVCLDGPAGSGKSTLAAAVADLAGEDGASVSVLHLDDVYEGWSGLAGAPPRVAREVLAPLAVGRVGGFRPYDWHAGALAGAERLVRPTDVLVLEGVGAGARVCAAYATLLVWVDAPVDVRRERALRRDGRTFTPHWDAWAASEARHFAAERTRERADLVLDGS